MISDIKILIVDDGTLSSLRVLTGLKNSGFNYIELAVNANCMFDYLDRGNFGLIISNWSRLEMNGMDFIKNVRKRSIYKDIPIMMLTNPYDAKNFSASLKDDDVTCIPKPLDFKSIGEAIQEIFAKKETPAIAGASKEKA